MNAKNLVLFSIWKVLGLILFLLILGLFNLSAYFIRNPLFSEMVNMINENIITILFVAGFYILGEIFLSTRKPYKFMGPIFNGFGGFFFAYFMVGIVLFIGEFVEGTFFEPLQKYQRIIYSLSFFVVLFYGYYKIYTQKKNYVLHNKKT